MINDLLPIAMACFLLASVETAAIGRMFALKHGYRFDPNREFLAIGSANLLSGLGHGFPISGGLSQSLVNESAGARTPLSGLIAALIIGDDHAVLLGRPERSAAARAGGDRPGGGRRPGPRAR